MKKSLLIVLVMMGCMSAFAQMNDKVTTQNNRPVKARKKAHEKRAPVCAPFYIGFSYGVNNPSGFIGLDLNLPLTSHLSLGAGAGLGTWGNKVKLDIKYALKGCASGFAFGGGITYSFGEDNFNTSLATIYNTETVTLQLQSQANVFVAAYYYWYIGRGANKCYAELGWSVPLSGPSYTETNGDPLTATSDQVVKILAPGGLMIGMGYTFGIGHKR
jgi:hypothetical protein